MKKLLIILGLVSGLNASSINYDKLSKEIYKYQIEKLGDTTQLNTLYNIRNKARCFSNIRVSTNDTLFLVESFCKDVENGNDSYYLTIFNCRNSFSFKTRITNTYKLRLLNGKYQSANQDFEISNLNYSFFSNYVLSLISLWSLPEIDDESIKYTVQYPSQVYITRLVINKKRWTVDCHKFTEFYNLQKESVR